MEKWLNKTSTKLEKWSEKFFILIDKYAHKSLTSFILTIIVLYIILPTICFTLSSYGSRSVGITFPFVDEKLIYDDAQARYVHDFSWSDMILGAIFMTGVVTIAQKIKIYEFIKELFWKPPVMTKKIILTAPSHWASYLINNDTSSLEPHEKEACNAWLARQHVGRPIDCKDAGFKQFHSAFEEFPLAADCQTYVFLSEE